MDLEKLVFQGIEKFEIYTILALESLNSILLMVIWCFCRACGATKAKHLYTKLPRWTILYIYVLVIINKSFACLDVTMFPMLYKALVRPILEYANAIWDPFFVIDQIAIEKVQKRATKMVSTIKNLPYNEHLIILKLPSL